MSRTGENIYRRKDGRWEGRYVKGREHKKTYFGYVFGKTYRETKNKLSLARSQWNQQINCYKMKKNTIAFLGKSWLQDSAANLKPSTIAKYGEYLRRYIYPQFASMDIAGITNKDVAAFCRKLLIAGGVNEQGLSPKTVQEIFRVMKQIRKYALLCQCAVGYTNDCICIKQNVSPMRVFTSQELERLQTFLEEKRDRICQGILLCLLTGLRLGEICALKWEDISLEDKVIHIRKTLQRISCQDDAKVKTKIIITSPKTSYSLRTIPLPEKLYTLFVPEVQPGTFFLTGQKDSYIEPRTMQNRFKAVLKACDIAKANFHALRHTFATTWVEAGQDIKCLSMILGHANVNITLNRYVHPSMNLKRAGIEQVMKFSHKPSDKPS